MNLYELVVARALSSGSGGGGSWQTVFEGSVTTVEEDGEIFGIIENLTLTGDSIKATLNGTEYILPKTEYGYGVIGEQGPDFSTYPLFIAAGGGADSCALYTPTAGTYTLKIEAPPRESEISFVKITVDNPERYYDAALQGCFCGETSSEYLINAATGVYDMILYKGKGGLQMELSPSRTAVVTGDVEELGGDAYLVSGDCTVTIS